MMGTMAMRQPENWLYEIWQQGHDSPCYVMVPNAKDLVKSHLMIAVREEVEVLKEKISELMDKINQLEVENTILKANMSQETLQQLQMQTQLQITGGTGSGAGNNMITAPQSSTVAVASVVPAAVVTAGILQQQPPIPSSSVVQQKQQSQQHQSNVATIANAAAATVAATSATAIVVGGAVGGGLTSNLTPIAVVAGSGEIGAVNENTLVSGAAAAEAIVGADGGTATNGSMC